MADVDPKSDVLDQLLMLMDLEILENEKDWGAIVALDHLDRIPEEKDGTGGEQHEK